MSAFLGVPVRLGVLNHVHAVAGFRDRGAQRNVLYASAEPTVSVPFRMSQAHQIVGIPHLACDVQLGQVLVAYGVRVAVRVVGSSYRQDRAPNHFLGVSAVRS